jgi:polyphosphate kinase
MNKNNINIIYPKSNREMSWLAFNERVLQEAMDKSNPTLERLRFLGIYSNNLDEFFRVRVSTINRLAQEKSNFKLGFNPKKLLAEIYNKLREDEVIFTQTYRDIKEELVKKKIHIIGEEHLEETHKIWLNKYFNSTLRQGIVPIILDSKLRFPILKDKSIYLAVKMSKLGIKNIRYSLIEIPTEYFGRFVQLPEIKGEKYVIMLDDVIRHFLHDIYKVFDFDQIEAYTIKVTRDAELDFESDLYSSMIEKLSSSLKLRKKGRPVRFIVDKHIPEDLLFYILSKMRISSNNVVKSGRYHNFKDFMSFPNFGMNDIIYNKPELVENSRFEKEKTIFKAIEKRDVLLIYPFNSFDYLLNFLREASIDTKVSEIKMSLYRLSKKSQIANILINAAKNGKKVTVFMELTARFDEENNIYWAELMKDEGVNVIYGIENLKVHSKIIYITKREGKLVKHYCNISTGNFNESTASIYSDFSLFTSDSRLTYEVGKVFTFLEKKQVYRFKNLLVSPFNVRSSILNLIKNEINHAKAGKDAEILMKMNSLVDDEIIDRLYEASRAGVKVRLIVRGICCLIPGMAEISENIEARSIVDRYLEHARFYYFKNDGDHKMYIGSADLMTRNIDFRVEVITPIYDKALQQKIVEFFEIQWNDNVKARIHNVEMNNQKVKNRKKAHRSQYELYNWLRKLNS